MFSSLSVFFRVHAEPMALNFCTTTERCFFQKGHNTDSMLSENEKETPPNCEAHKVHLQAFPSVLPSVSSYIANVKSVLLL